MVRVLKNSRGIETVVPLPWGGQVRVYVLQPYTLVKDQRTGVETNDATSVLNGDIDKFLIAALEQRLCECAYDDWSGAVLDGKV
jgi:peptide chain release factor 2